jgi:hypothetical protein
MKGRDSGERDIIDLSRKQSAVYVVGGPADDEFGFNQCGEFCGVAGGEMESRSRDAHLSATLIKLAILLCLESDRG